MKKRTWCCVTGIALLTATAGMAATSHVLTQKLVSLAVDRETEGNEKAKERVRRKLQGTQRNDRLNNEIRSAAEALKECDASEVSITATDGTVLVGHWIPCESPKRIVVAMHGWRSTWFNDFGILAPFLKTSGCSILYAEQRGQNNSGGDCMGFGITERHDCARWIEWVTTREPTLPVYAMGISMGATTVLMASDLPLSERVRGIIADCGFTSPHAIWQHVGKHNLHLGFGIRENAVRTLCKTRWNGENGDRSAADSLSKTSLPVLFIHGSDDDFVPVTMTYENYKACVSPKRLLIVPGAGHAASYVTDRTAYERSLCDFWSDCEE